ncbi:MAG TPA: hypothetical protein G4N99_07515 [Thermoflexia bacterium]|nr:hypothetical protein [Thermoflexia bacterium]
MAQLTVKLSRRAGAGESICHSTHRKHAEQLDWRKIAKSPPTRGGRSSETIT